MPQLPNGVIRFGVFEVEPQAGIIRKGGTRVRLQEQPFRVLLALLEKPGEVVTREELHEKVWKGEPFGDIDHRLNIAVNRIREALRDSAETPRFVETLPRRGYRFIAPVESPQAVEPVASPPPRRRWWVWAAAVPVLAAVVWLLTPRREPESPLIPVPLTSYPGVENSPDFSPDGTQVAFQWNGEQQDNFDIYVKVVGSDPPLRLTRDPAPDWSPAWSPDGRQIAFLRTLDAERSAIYVVPPVSGPERKVAEVTPGEPMGIRQAQIAGRQLSWSPDGKWLATIDRGTSGEPACVFLVPVEHGERRRLTRLDSAGHDLAPAFSPDGRSLAFIRCHTLAKCELLLLDLGLDYSATSQPRQLTKGTHSMTGLAWSQDGKQLVFASSEMGHPNEQAVLWRAPASGSFPAQRLAFAGPSTQSPAISRQGRLAYTRWVTDYDLWQIDAGGSMKRLVASSFWESSPQFSPDGRKIAFASERTGHAEIWIANQDGSDPRQLTFGSLHAGTPRWSPDSRSVAFDSLGEDGYYHIWVVDAAGGQPRRMTGQSNEAIPSYSKDGKWIYFFSVLTGREEIMRMPASGGEPTQITRNGGFTAFESPDGASIYYTKTESLTGDALWRTPVEGGEEEQVLPSVSLRAFAVVEDGVYYIPGPGPDGATSLQFLDLASGKSRSIARIDGHLALGLAVSPDRKRFVIAQSIQWGSDLMMVENFR